MMEFKRRPWTGGRANSNLTLTGVQPANVGDYSVIVSNAAGYTISSEARLARVHIPATITSASQTNKLVVAENKTWTVTAIGDLPVTFQWQFNGNPIPDATNTFLQLTNLQESDSGLYTVTVSNAYATTVSAPYQLTVFRSPFTLSLKGSWVAQPNSNGFAEAIRVVGHYAYLANSRAGLEVIDVSNPSAPFRVANYQTGGWAQDVEVVGAYAYVADFLTGLHVLDVHDPVHPALVGRYDTQGRFTFAEGPNVLQVLGSVAYIVLDGSAFQVVDVTDPANPFLVTTYTTPVLTYANGLRAVGNRVYVVGGHWINEDDTVGFLEIFDATQRTNLTQIGLCDTPDVGWGVDVADGYAYIAGEETAFTVVNVQDPTNPAPVGGFATYG